MAAAFLTSEDKAALLHAIKDVEQRSNAEVVIAVRAHSGSYLHADLITGIAFGYFALWFQLFSPLEFSLELILVAPLALGILGGLLSRHTPMVRRLLTPAAARRARIRSASLIAFHEKGVSHTRDRTGLLVFVSLLERAAEVVADRGVLARVPSREWAETVAAIDTCVASGRPGAEVAARIRDLGQVLERTLPHREDDVNELPDEVAE